MKKNHLSRPKTVIFILLASIFLSGFFQAYRSGIVARFFSRGKMESELARDLREQMGSCFKNGGRRECYEKIAHVLSERYSLSFLLRIIQKNETYPEVFSRCHEVTHLLAREAFHKTQQVAETFAECTPVCHGGCYHGVLEQYFKEKNIQSNGLSASDLSREVGSICGTEAQYAAPRTYTECLHGIGHALMFITASDVPRSLVFCDTLSSVRDRETCYGGVFMENSSSSTNQDHPTAYLKSGDPMYPCTILKAQYLGECYKYQSSYFAELTGWDWGKTIALCDSVPSLYKSNCFFFIGVDQVGNSQSLDSALHVCGLARTGALKAMCIKGVANALGGRYVKEPSRLLDFCAKVEPADKKICYQELDNAILSWGENPHQYKNSETCGNIHDEYGRRWCDAS